jgi:CubicO group peptidase (beta-lactamase class C family)
MSEARILDAARALLRNAIEARVCPTAVVEVGSSRGVLWREAFNTGVDTIFDLASLTKPIATTSVILSLVDRGRLSFDSPVADFFDEWRGDDRRNVTVRHLLEHSSGLAPRLVDPPPEGRREFEHEICSMKLEYAPGTKSVYSDLDFILLGFMAADLSGAPFDEAFTSLVRPASGHLAFGVPEPLIARTAPTTPLEEDLRRGRTLNGEVHDNYAAALGGVAGHAGLFGTAPAVGEFAQLALRGLTGDVFVPSPFSPALMRAAAARSQVPGSSRALGWDTMLPASSCGSRLSPSAIGHVGFTGTSLWIDPARDRYYVLLTNRVHGGGTSEQMQALRRAFHDTLADL